MINEDIEEKVYGEVLQDKILEAKHDGLVQGVAEEDICEFGHNKHGFKVCTTCDK